MHMYVIKYKANKGVVVVVVVVVVVRKMIVLLQLLAPSQV